MSSLDLDNLDLYVKNHEGPDFIITKFKIVENEPTDEAPNPWQIQVEWKPAEEKVFPEESQVDNIIQDMVKEILSDIIDASKKAHNSA